MLEMGNVIWVASAERGDSWSDLGRAREKENAGEGTNLLGRSEELTWIRRISEKLMITLRDGRKLIGVLRAWDQVRSSF